MRKLVALVFVAVLLFAGDAAARSYASAQLEDRLAVALRLQGEPRVEIDGFPFTVGLVRGRFDKVSISAHGVRADEIALSEARINLKGVRFSTSAALEGQLRAVDFSSARGTALITVPALEDAIDRFPLDFSLPELDLSAIRLDGNSLDLGPFHLDLPVLAEGMRYEALHAEDGVLHLAFSLNGDELQLEEV